MFRCLSIIACFLLYTAGTLHAKPMIQFDKKEIQCGHVYEGTTKKLDAVFTVKNSGDATLKLLRVAPGCGCTVVKYDSIIEPGKSTKISAVVNIHGFRSGVMSKPVTVISNAGNDSIVRLLINATIHAPIDPSTILIEMPNGKKTSLQLTSGKKDLQVTGVTFTPFTPPDKSAPKKPPVTVNFTLIPVNSAATGGPKIYQLELEPFPIAAATEGAFNISTNHPNKKLMRIRGNVGK